MRHHSSGSTFQAGPTGPPSAALLISRSAGPQLPLQLGEGVRGLVLVTDVRGGGRGHASGGADVLGSRGQLIGGAGYQADGCPCVSERLG